ncbi:hypothetical protein MUN89_02465 [Halobacillus salinarum]|uniref:Uncharacterized protein n=1 Tax=Halobacillus salinarum TaxID=2932257 RepID=A0ABY4ELU6_9BACI|nr:hypothetical protein [Halobacillus salinarum]UOQ44838.1 hypothetical protein MUN89_02465 [Halobacillus salinarum]
MKSIGENAVGLSSILISIIIGATSIKIARDSLVFNQRSFILKDSYEPILTDINNNRVVRLISSTEFCYGKLKEVKESYVYQAFEKNEQELIDEVLELERNINIFKNKSNNILHNMLVKLLNNNYSVDSFEKEKGETHKLITEVFIGDDKAQQKSKEKLIDLFLNNGLHELVLLNNAENIWCRMQEFYIVEDSNGIEQEFVTHEKMFTLDHLLKKNINLDEIDIPHVREEEVILAEMERIGNLLQDEYKNSKEYKCAYNSFNKLVDNINILESKLIGRIRKLIIPKKGWLEKFKG